MKILFIGGTGTISMAITKQILKEGKDELYLLNRGNRNNSLEGIKEINVDINGDINKVKEKLKDLEFDCVCDFIIFHLDQAKRDYELFKDKTKQFIFISSASAYKKPVDNFIITEKTPLENPYWQYSRDKKEIEEYFLDKYKTEGFPITIVRPSHTYDERSVPLGVHGAKGSYQVVKRMLEGKKVIIHGDGESLWVMTNNYDFAKLFVPLIGNSKTIGEAYQITGDEVLTWNNIYKNIANALNVELKPIYVSSQLLAELSDFEGTLIGDKANSVIFDNKKVKEFNPNFKQEILFKDGIKKTIDYVLTHKECQIEDKEFDDFCDKLIEKLEKIKEEF
ncbi:MAG: NAD-dependent epimerase/dehydratase family protein [Acholeplasmatales bacterium]|nr:NAD-dependent epimerase/dehydratase family protein [Acholeplasmatales bacterium]